MCPRYVRVVPAVSTARHGGGNGDDRAVGGGDVDEGVGEDGGVRRGRGLGGELLARGHVELGHAVVPAAARKANVGHTGCGIAHILCMN